MMRAKLGYHPNHPYRRVTGPHRNAEEAQQAYDAEIVRLLDEYLIKTFGVWGYRYMRYVVDPVLTRVVYPVLRVTWWPVLRAYRRWRYVPFGKHPEDSPE